MELLPRITRAQAMDVLSSQANLAGYRAVIEARGAFERGFPMMMTAAGTVPPARVFVIGAGVAGLQAIATARRLGAIVSATDVRPAAKEEIKSLGASLRRCRGRGNRRPDRRLCARDERGVPPEAGGADGQHGRQERYRDLHRPGDGPQAPVIVTQPMVASMRPGSVIVDLAADAGGNCEATVPGERSSPRTACTSSATATGPAASRSRRAALYARNLLTFLTTFWDKDAKAPKLPENDDIVKGVMLTRGGAVVHPNFLPSRLPSLGRLRCRPHRRQSRLSPGDLDEPDTRSPTKPARARPSQANATGGRTPQHAAPRAVRADRWPPRSSRSCSCWRSS